MRICNLDDGLGQLTHAMSDVNECWNETKAHWTDEAGRQFEETHLRPLPAQMQLVLGAVQSLKQCIEKAVRELDDRGEET